MLHESSSPISHPPVHTATLLSLGLERDLEPPLEVEESVEVGKDEMGCVLRNETVLNERARVRLQREEEKNVSFSTLAERKDSPMESKEPDLPEEPPTPERTSSPSPSTP